MQAQAPIHCADPLQADIGLLRHAAATTARTLDDWPGLRGVHARLAASLDKMRPRRACGVWEGRVEEAVRRVMAVADQRSAAGADGLLDEATPLSIFKAPSGYRPFLPVPLWGEVRDPAASGVGKADAPAEGASGIPSRRQAAQGDAAQEGAGAARRAAGVKPLRVLARLGRDGRCSAATWTTTTPIRRSRRRTNWRSSRSASTSGARRDPQARPRPGPGRHRDKHAAGRAHLSRMGPPPTGLSSRPLPRDRGARRRGGRGLDARRSRRFAASARCAAISRRSGRAGRSCPAQTGWRRARSLGAGARPCRPPRRQRCERAHLPAGA